MSDSKYNSRNKNSRSRSRDRHNRDNRRRSPENRSGRRSEREESPKRRYHEDDSRRSGRDRDDHKYGSRHKNYRSKSRSRSRDRHNRGDRRRSPENRTDRRSEREESPRRRQGSSVKHGDMQVEKERNSERTNQRRDDRSKSRSRSKDRRRDNNYYNNNRSRNDNQRRDTRSDNYRTDYNQRRNDSSYTTDRKGDKKSYYSKSWKHGSEASTEDNSFRTSTMKILTHPETLDYPYCRYHITEEGVDYAYNSIKSYKLDIKPAEYSLRNIPELKTEDKMFKRRNSVISVLADDYWKMGFLSDFFNEEVRVRGKRSDAKESPFDYWTHNREAVINEMREKKMLLTIKDVNEFLYTKNIGCNTFKPYLLVGMAKYFNSTHVLDFSSGWGDRLIGALAAGISYVGVDPNDELFEGYKKILTRFGNGRLIADEPLTYENNWNMYKMICAPFQKADLQRYTCDLIFTSPPYFDLEIYTDKPTQSVQEFPDVNGWEKGFLYVSLAKAWDLLRPYGYLVLIMNNIFGKPDFTLKAVDWATKNLPDAEYLGLLPYAHMGYNRHWKSPQPMWIWQKKSDVKLNDIYYIGNERCEKIECKDFAELETIIGHRVKRTDKNCIYLGDEESSQTLDYGTITINNSQFKIKKYINLTKEGLNPKIEVEEITTLPNKTLRLICDHQLPGGTKQRGVDFSSTAADEVVYAGPYVGYAQIAMAIGGKLYGKRTTVFLSKNDYYATLRAMQYGCQVKLVHEGTLKVLQEQARTYAKETGSHLLEFGFDTQDFKDELFRNITSSIEGVIPTAEITNTVWVVAGSATLLGVLYKVFPNARFGVVQVGKTIWPDQMELNRTKLYVAKEDFYEPTRELPPYKSAIRYDAKAWQFIREHAADGDLIWNVAN